MMKRAYSVLDVKEFDDEKRQLTGIASTPSVDRYGDVVDPEGAAFDLPIALLWQHDAKQPIGHVTKAKVTKSGIEIVASLVKITEPGRLKDRLDEAWQSIRSKLVRGLSIGFTPIEYSFIEGTGGVHFSKWNWLELSAVTIPANQDASIQTIKSIDTAQRAASGLSLRSGVRLITSSPGVSGSPAVRKRGPVQLIPRKYDRGKEDTAGPDQGSGEHPRR